MKTSEEKAKELIKFFREYCITAKNINQDQSIYTELDYAKKCAIRCVEEVLSGCPTCPSEVYLSDWNFDYNQAQIEEKIQAKTYWENVLEYIHLM